MPSTPKISKETLLKKALDILEREGYEAVTIKRLAQETGCSTQPISWQFGGMEKLREALADYALAEALRVTESDAGGAAMERFAHSGERYLELAIDRPRLFCFVYLGGSGKHISGGLTDLALCGHDQALLSAIAQEAGISPEDAGRLVETMVIYNHGMACMIAAGLVHETRETAFRMLCRTGAAFLVSLGVSRERANALAGTEEDA